MKGQQLPLSVQLRESASFDSFFAGPNDAVVAALRAPRGTMLVYGAIGSGRTHLLQATTRSLRGSYVPFAELQQHGAEILEGLEEPALLCLDDLDAVAAERDWALALLRLLDARHAQNKTTVMSSIAPPDRMTLALPDLQTRLMRSAILGLKPLDDADRATLLRERAQARGLELPPETSRWLLTQLARDTGSLLIALEKLDRASLSAQRRLTLPFVQRALAPETSQTN